MDTQRSGFPALQIHLNQALPKPAWLSQRPLRHDSTEVAGKPTRRRFAISYKRKIVALAAGAAGGRGWRFAS
ncbi:MAG: hypothetical protein IPH76_01795 [Xanthomonadales bacterium]|nr:hypothetical protein [Xanthomonadales bacterium]